MSTNHEDESNVLYKILPITMYGPRGGKRTFALLDEGSSLTLVNRELADDIGLKGEIQSLSIKGIDSEAKIQEAEVTNARISGTHRDAQIYDINNIRIVRSLDLPQQTLDVKRLYNQLDYIQNVPIEDFTSGVPQVLIGLQHAHLGVPTHIPLSSGTGPIMITTKLGHLLYGPRGDSSDRVNSEIQRVLFGDFTTW